MSTPKIAFIIEDEPAIRRIIAYSLHDLGFVTREFDQASVASRAFAAAQPDLTFLDVSLKNSDAVEFIRSLGAGKHYGTIQLMTGKYPALVEEICGIGSRYGLRMLPPLLKPFRPDAIRDIVHKFESETNKDAAQTDMPAGRPAAPSRELHVDHILSSGWLEFWYQPKINLKTNSLAGAECLARANHPEWGIIPAESFMQTADEGNLIRLSRRALTTALRDWSTFHQKGFNLRIAVNVPIGALVAFDIPELIREHRPKSENWPGMIIEVTENQAIADLARAQEIATQLRIYNASLSVDDFGAGYSHLARLRQLPFAELKIDRSLVANCATDMTNKRMCEMIIRLAHQFNIPAVAEGIETTAELKSLKEMGCDCGQGYLFSPALPIEHFTALLQRRAGSAVA